jgi:hypothetical protein
VLVIVIVVDLPAARWVEKKGYCGLSLVFGVQAWRRLAVWVCAFVCSIFGLWLVVCVPRVLAFP